MSEKDLDGVMVVRAMQRYGLDPTDEELVEAFVRAYVADVNYRAGGSRYERAAKKTAQMQAQALRHAQLEAMGIDPIMEPNRYLEELGNLVFAPVEPAESKVEKQSVLDTDDPGELFEMAMGRQGQDPGDQVSGQAWRRMMDAGVWLEDGDPEIKQVDRSSPEKFLETVDQAINAKKGRLRETDVVGTDDLDQLWRMGEEEL